MGLFQAIRQYPRILKFIAYGQGDRIFTEELLNEKFIYFSYVVQLDQDYEKRGLQAFN